MNSSISSAALTLTNFKNQYPLTTSADLQSFVLGYNAAINDYNSQFSSLINEFDRLKITTSTTDETLSVTRSLCSKLKTIIGQNNV